MAPKISLQQARVFPGSFVVARARGAELIDEQSKQIRWEIKNGACCSDAEDTGRKAACLIFQIFCLVNNFDNLRPVQVAEKQRDEAICGSVK